MTKTTAMYANGVGKPQDLFNEERFIASQKGTIDLGSFYTQVRQAKQGFQELGDLPLSYKLAALGAAATLTIGTAVYTNPDAKAQISGDIQQACLDILTTASAGLSPASIAAITQSLGIYTNPAVPIPKKMVPIIIGLATMVYSSGCVDKNPMEDIISDKTKEISHGEIDDSHGGMEIVDEIITNPKTEEPEDENDASQVIIDGWTHPMSLNPADYITPDGDCTALKKIHRRLWLENSPLPVSGIKSK